MAVIDIDTTDEFLDADEIVYEDGTKLSDLAAGPPKSGRQLPPLPKPEFDEPPAVVLHPDGSITTKPQPSGASRRD